MDRDGESNSPTKLNTECNNFMFIIKATMHLLPQSGDRNRANRWMRKLATCNRSIEEMKLRNDFMYYLMMNVRSHELRPPFTENPPYGPLPSLAGLLPDAGQMASLEGDVLGDVHGDSASKPMLFESSPDGGEFLAQQPIPRCGAFCYLAVVSKGGAKQ